MCPQRTGPGTRLFGGCFGMKKGNFGAGMCWGWMSLPQPPRLMATMSMSGVGAGHQQGGGPGTGGWQLCVHCPRAQFEMRLFLRILLFWEDPCCWVLPHPLAMAGGDSRDQQRWLRSGALSHCDRHARGAREQEKGFFRAA